MNITNDRNLPAAMWRAAQRSEHRGADYSATQLLRSPRHLWLERRHDDEISQDVADMMWALQGTMMHAMLERGEGETEFTESYMTAEIEGVTVSGTADLYDMAAGKISDWKSTSVYSIIYNSRDIEWEQQLNIYAWLFRRNGFDVKALEIVALLRDWQKSKARFDKKYPQHQVEVIPITLWSQEDAEAFVGMRVRDLEKHRDTKDSILPYCSDEYRWKDPEKWAVMKQGRKSALKLHDTSSQAEAQAASVPGSYVEHRHSVARRCGDYCLAAAFCNQHKADI